MDNKVKKDAETIGSAERKGQSNIDEALKASETKETCNFKLEVKEESLRTKNELEKETKERKTNCRNIKLCLNRRKKTVIMKAEAG